MPSTLILDLYRTLEFEETGPGQYHAELEINPNHSIFRGHFPGFPVMPGVCMIQIFREMLEQALALDLRLTAARNIKFLSILNPNAHPRVHFFLSQKTSEGGNVEADGILKSGDLTFFKMSATFSPEELF